MITPSFIPVLVYLPNLLFQSEKKRVVQEVEEIYLDQLYEEVQEIEQLVQHKMQWRGAVQVTFLFYFLFLFRRSLSPTLFSTYSLLSTK